ncbi:MAG: LTA synthase family protein [Hoylesella enoeca]|uniref:LTA synthase family protein n=1 Tax=Hoylesella enoeca TaxID=76123 RepID=UPI003F9ECA24
MKAHFFQEGSVRRRNPVFLMMCKFLKAYLAVGFLLRIILMLTTPSDAGLTFGSVFRCLGVGILADFGMGILLTVPLMILYLGLNEVKYGRKTGLVINVLLLVAFLYSYWPQSIFYQYGGGAPKVAHLFLGWKLLSFSFRYFIPRIRMVWRRLSLYFAWAVYVFLMLVVAVGEYLFWQEFGVRYNFIAVDYLVYTHEVIGNIMESYAIMPLSAVLLMLSVGIIYGQSRKERFKLEKLYGPKLLAVHLGIYLLFCAVGYGITVSTHSLSSQNQYVTQLEQNGACDFVIAFQSSRLDYDRFYAMLPEQKCKTLYRQLAGLDMQGEKSIGDSLQPQRCNIVLITVESLSADFLKRYGNKEQITPNIDRLMDQSLVFDRLYANGNRTVRGLEALSLCIPPSAGESIIKQKNNRMGSLSVGDVLRKQGYLVQYLYGGDSYFDNMGDFFSHNGYQVIDRSSINQHDITFSNIWGVCDEDIFNKGLKVFDDNAKRKRPFFAQFMTTSNHRPYTYPDGKIKVDGDKNTREAAVKYTDYAIGKFIRDASRKPWFGNTVFVIIADHCASSAGKTSLPIDRYHIPGFIYSPGRIAPKSVDKVCSQIDVMPTLFALLHLRCRVRFAGQDILSPSFHPRAFMATYQDLGYLENNRLTILSPVKKITQYDVTPLADGTFEETPTHRPQPSLIMKAQAYYQYTNLYLCKNR